MKKYVIGSLISALILAVLGTVFVVIGVMCGGVHQAKDEFLENIGNWSHDFNFEIVDGFDGNEIVMENVSFNPNQTVHIGKYTDLEAFTKDEVSSMTLCIAAGSFDVEQSTNEYYGVDGSCEGGFQYYVENGVLYVLAIYSDSNNAITIYLPSGCNYDFVNLSLAAGEVDVTTSISSNEMELALGAGNISITDISADSVNASVGAGSLTITNGTIGDGNFDVAAGELVYQGSISGNVEGAVAAGSISMEIAGEEDMFNYDLSTALGGVSAGTHYTAGIGSNESYENDTNQTMKLSSAAGYIEVDFY